MELAFENTDLQILLEGMPALMDLCMDSTNFNMISLKMLQDSCTLITIRHPSLHQCNELTGVATQEALCTLKNLESLVTDYVTDADIIKDNRPWICTGLKKLVIAIFPLNRTTTQPSILARLSHLKALEHLDLRTSTLNYHIHQTGILPLNSFRSIAFD
jgi:hypothetical protein